MLYPLKFIPVYKNIIWGGRNIEKKFKRDLPDGNIAESWEVCCRKDGMSIISNGCLKGRTLDEIIREYGENLLGNKVHNQADSVFPLLIKIIDANDKLSVQVHPGDDYAGLENGESGKTEMWYIIDAKPDAKLVYGLKDYVTKEDLIKAVNDKNISSTLKMVPVKPGDSLYIPAGTVHAILDGILIAEIQQNSNTTYRVYDWDRVDKDGRPRELHLEKAIDVINFISGENMNYPEKIEDFSSCTIKDLVKSQYFTVEELNISDSYRSAANGERFYIYMVIEGTGVINYSGRQLDIISGETIMIPSSLGEYDITGSMKVLRIYI